MARSSPHLPRTPNVCRLPGFVLLDEGKNPIYYNAEALRILSKPPGGTEAALSGLFSKKTLASLMRRALCENGGGSTEFVSGNRRYTCRTFSVFQEATPSARPVTGLLIEPSHWNASRESEITQKFHLSEREEETVSLLSLGLTSKEIASRMGVSPNTIKAFLRLIMTKMAVGTRSGIIGKLLRNN